MCIYSNAIIALQRSLYVTYITHILKIQQLVAACKAGDVGTVQRLLSHGVNANGSHEVQCTYMCIHVCVFSECEDLTSQSLCVQLSDDVMVSNEVL